MKRLLLKILSISMLLLSQPTWAELSGNELLDTCSSYDSDNPINDVSKSIMCISYIRGVLDGQRSGFFAGYLNGRLIDGRNTTTSEVAIEEAYKLKELRQDAGFCEYGSQTIEQYARIIVKYLKDHPDGLHFHASTQVDQALSEAFPLPCNQ